MPFWGSGEIKNHNKGPLGHLAFIDQDDKQRKKKEQEKEEKKGEKEQVLKLYKKTATRSLTPSSTRCPISTPLQEQRGRIEKTASLGLGLLLVWIPTAWSNSGEEEQYGHEFFTIRLERRPRRGDRPAHGMQATLGATGSIIIFSFFGKKNEDLFGC